MLGWLGLLLGGGSSLHLEFNTTIEGDIIFSMRHKERSSLYKAGKIFFREYRNQSENRALPLRQNDALEFIYDNPEYLSNSVNELDTIISLINDPTTRFLNELNAMGCSNALALIDLLEGEEEEPAQVLPPISLNEERYIQSSLPKSIVRFAQRVASGDIDQGNTESYGFHRYMNDPEALIASLIIDGYDNYSRDFDLHGKKLEFHPIVALAITEVAAYLAHHGIGNPVLFDSANREDFWVIEFPFTIMQRYPHIKTGFSPTFIEMAIARQKDFGRSDTIFV